MRVLGLDMGTKTIGVALSDELGLTAQPLTTIRRKGIRKDIEAVVTLMEEHSVGTVVVGMPVKMDGTMSETTRMVSGFVERLAKETDAEVRTWDERLSTAAVERVLIDGDLSRAKRKKVVDKMAAAYILQGFMDRERSPGA